MPGCNDTDLFGLDEAFGGFDAFNSAIRLAKAPPMGAINTNLRLRVVGASIILTSFDNSRATSGTGNNVYPSPSPTHSMIASRLSRTTVFPSSGLAKFSISCAINLPIPVSGMK